jgi:hypothetical protein
MGVHLHLFDSVDEIDSVHSHRLGTLLVFIGQRPGPNQLFVWFCKLGLVYRLSR